MMLGLVSRPPSGCQRSRLRSKISRHRSASPRWVLAKPNRVSPATTVTWLPTSPTESGGGACLRRGDECRRRRLGDGGRHPWRDRHHDERGGDQPLGEEADAAARRRRRGEAGRRRTSQITHLLADFDDEGHGEPQPDQPRQHGEHADEEGDVVAQLEAGAAGPRVADEHDQQQRDTDEQQACRGDRPDGAEHPPVHGALPMPAAGDAVELDETDRPPGRMR